MNSSATKKPTFLWQGALIVTPVLLLTLFGAFSVWQDSTLARHEAASRAQSLADDLLPRLSTELFARAGHGEHEFQVDSSGRLVSPPPYAAVPVPHPLDLRALNSEQTALWRNALAAEANGAAPKAAAQAYLQFLQTNPPRGFAAAARYTAAVLLSQADEFDPAAVQLAILLERFPDAVGESGLPLKPLAEVRLLELRARGARAETAPTLTLDIVCSNLVSQPTLLSSRLLANLADEAKTPADRATINSWRRVWEADETSRALFRAVSNKLGRFEFKLESAAALPAIDRPYPRQCVWFRAPGGGPPALNEAESDWLAVEAEETAAEHRFVCRSEWELGTDLQSLAKSWKYIPDYFGVAVEAAGRRVPWPGSDLQVWHEVHYLGGKGAGQVRHESTGEMASTVLASSGSIDDPLKISIYLTSPTALYKYQHARTFWLSTLIAATALAALIGLLAAYRAFRRQLRLSEVKRDFVSSVSHELRAPIASVRLMAESLERGKVADPARQQEYFRFIDQECRRLSSLVENVLDFARIEQGRKQYEFEPTDLLALTRKTVQLMETYAAERAVRLILAVPDSQTATRPYQLSADGKAVQQALINLIDNAVKHSPKDGSVTIGLQLDTHCESRPATPDASATTPPVPYLLLWVEDNGPGIPRSEHEKIFERFYRTGSELRRETQGVGIGLSIVKHIVEAHGGRVLVRSDVGQGSRFTIELPMKEPQDLMENATPEDK